MFISVKITRFSDIQILIINENIKLFNYKLLKNTKINAFVDSFYYFAQKILLTLKHLKIDFSDI